MDIQFNLNIVTLLMCVITLAMAIAALMPQIKTALGLLRDGLMWATLFGVIGFVGFVGWVRFAEARKARSEADDKNLVSQQSPANEAELGKERLLVGQPSQTVPVANNLHPSASARTAKQTSSIRPNRSRTHLARRSIGHQPNP